MLCQFMFNNFKSYKSSTVFDFQALNLIEFRDSLLREDKCADILPVGVIYGPNGGGKSNLLQALVCLVSTVVKPIYDLKKTRNKFIFQQEERCQPFCFDKSSRNKPTDFQIFFRVPDFEYRYTLSLHNEIVQAEALYRKEIGGRRPTRLFERTQDNITLGSCLKGNSINTSVNKKMPYLTFLAINYDLPTVAPAQDFFESCIIMDYANPASESQILLSDDEWLKNSVIRALNDIDIDITDYYFDRKADQFYLRREFNNAFWDLPFLAESEGTKKLFASLPALLLALKEGRLVIVDELDVKLHPKLLRYIIQLFKNPDMNTRGAQLLFTSHDMTTMSNTVFRRDEIWFAAENANHESELYSLAEIRGENNERIKNTASYGKQYLEGRYGADPYLNNMLNGSGWQ